MTEWAARRFWDAVEVMPAGSGWTVHLDGRPIRTPGKQLLVMPTRPMAEAVADEWRDQGEQVDPMSMPATRSVNSAIDKVLPQMAEVVAALTAYGETDLLCYRAETPDELTLRQSKSWDPLLNWADATYSARLVPVAGVMPCAQDRAALDRLAAPVRAMNEFTLTGFHDLVMLSGSLVLGLAVCRGRLTAAEAWEVSRIDEEYQAGIWGRDEEADRAAAIRRDAFFAAERFVTLSAGGPKQP